MHRSVPSAPRVEQVRLAFSAAQALPRLDDPVAKDLSAVARAGDCLFLACDEAAGLERLRRTGADCYGDHQHILLSDFFDLPGGPDEEMDIEGLAAVDGYLWIVGSHSLKRKKPKGDDGEGVEALARMEEIEREANRYFLGRVPMEEETPGVFALRAKVGEREAACLDMGLGCGLARWLRKDPHLARFLKVPSKENGLDIEGIAIQGDRVWLGLRGPVLVGYAVVLELMLKQPKPGRLKPRKIGPNGRRYRKHLLDTGGLGIRDLRRSGKDLLLLVGPTMALEGTAQVLKWHGGVQDEAEGMVPTSRLERMADLPYRRQSDHPEGLELWPEAGDGAFVVVYDAPGPERRDATTRTVQADIFRPGSDHAGRKG
ncbi:DUF3616 domain-containing protein [Falsiroseomonas tokyonensis]|uniref:DUF3616 domain-containing protein n=1 Tax=Falsiroseomonas tokyonensis TaxID=430521 RepID=A0ABV7BM16_9PROT|nr:DUF3616 domain-containing protein [Falsiroseomonas tokyonensis]MBU8536619.1 DUF3616 domain-containing protein [Falsiroseomonas tokyonensis]